MEVSKERYEELKKVLSEEELRSVVVINSIKVKELPHSTAGRLIMQSTNWDEETDIGQYQYIYKVKKASGNYHQIVPLVFKTEEGALDFCKQILGDY